MGWNGPPPVAHREDFAVKQAKPCDGCGACRYSSAGQCLYCGRLMTGVVRVVNAVLPPSRKPVRY